MPQFDNIINPTTSYDIIEDNGTPLPARLILNFVSPDVSIVDDVANSRTNVIFPAYVHIAGSTMTGNLILNGDPTLPLQAATKQYVDSLAGGLTPITAVKYASTGAYTATYNNGASGVGATLTNAAAMAAFSIDGFTPSVNDRVLIKDQAAQAQNGIYTVTTVGSGAVNWVLTRATDYDTSAKIKTGTYTIASAGTMNSGVLYIMTTSGTITVGTTAIVWSPFESAANITVTAPLTKVGNVLGITTPLDPSYGGTGIANSSADTITLGGVINTGGDFITTPGNPITLTTTGSTNVTLPTTGTLVNTAVTILSSLASIGTITTGVWNGTIISPTYGGTGINNGSKTITIGGNFSTTGANTLNFTTIGNTSLTLPTSGTLMVGSNNLSELTNTTTARANLGLGTAATHAATDFLQSANNLSDVASASISRTNLGLAIGTNVEAWSAVLDTVTAGTYIGNVNLTTVGVISTGTWHGGIISPTFGGTGINNGSSTITLGGSFSTTGANTLNFTTSGNTSLTLPTSGTVMVGSNNLSEITNAATARSNLGIDVGLYQIVQQIFSVSGTYTPTSGMTYCFIDATGASGGSGGAEGGVGTAAAGAGGGGAGRAILLCTAATIGASKTVTIGAGGTAGAAGNNPGGDGGTTSVGTLISITGGGGGLGMAKTSTPNFSSNFGGIEGNPTAPGGIIYYGSEGTAGFVFSTAFFKAGDGGANPGGVPNVGPYANGSGGGTGDAGYNGNGASGAFATTVSKAGAVGSDGYVVITEYIKRG